MASSSTIAITPEKLEQLARLDSSVAAFKGRTNRQIQTIKGRDKKEDMLKKNKNSSSFMSNGCDLLGSADYKFFHVPTPIDVKPAPKKYSIKYIRASAEQPSQEKPCFFQTPPGIIFSHTIVGLGNKIPEGDDAPLGRKFSIVMLHGIYKKDENGDLTDEIDVFPVFSKYHADDWFTKNPFKRDVDEQKTIQYEINLFFKNINSVWNCAADFLINGTKLVTSQSVRNTRIKEKADIEGGEWIAHMRKRRNLGDHSIPELEAEEWKLTDLYQNDILPKTRLNGIKSIMSDPTVFTPSVDKFKTVLINSYLHDLKRTSAGRNKTDEEQEEIAAEMAEEYIKNNPDWEERLALCKFERRVWQAPDGIKDNMKKQEKIKTEVTKINDHISEKIAKKEPGLNEFALKKKTDEKLVEVITQQFQWKYNFPKVVDNRGREVYDPTHEKPIDRFIKPHFGLSIGTLCSVNFIVNLSVPTGADIPYGLKFNFFGHVMFITPVSYNIKKSMTANVFDFGDDVSEYAKEFEKNRIKEQEIAQKNALQYGNPFASSSVSLEQAKFLLSNQPLKVDFPQAAMENFIEENGLSASDNDTKGSDNDDDSTDDEKSKKNKKHKQKLMPKNGKKHKK